VIATAPGARAAGHALSERCRATFDVLDAQRGLFGAELHSTKAERDQLVTAVQLYRAVGAGWPTVQE